MDNLTIIIIVLAVVLVIASLLFFYPKIKMRLKGKKLKSNNNKPAEPIKEKKSNKVKRPVILTSTKPSEDVKQLAPPPVVSAERPQARPGFDDSRINLSREEPIKIDNIKSFVDDVSDNDYSNKSVLQSSMERGRAGRYNRSVINDSKDDYRGISMDDLDIEGNTVSVKSEDDTFSRARREKEDDLFNEFKNLSPEMKKILISNILDKKDGNK